MFSTTAPMDETDGQQGLAPLVVDGQRKKRKKANKRGNAQTLRDYWSGHGHEGPSGGSHEHEIGWGTPGDFDRCVAQVTEHAHMTPEQAKGYCNLRHHDALGYYPATHARMERGKSIKPTEIVVIGEGDTDHDGDGLFDADGDGDGAVARRVEKAQTAPPGGSSGGSGGGQARVPAGQGRASGEFGSGSGQASSKDPAIQRQQEQAAQASQGHKQQLEEQAHQLIVQAEQIDAQIGQLHAQEKALSAQLGATHVAGTGTGTTAGATSAQSAAASTSRAATSSSPAAASKPATSTSPHAAIVQQIAQISNHIVALTAQANQLRQQAAALYTQAAAIKAAPGPRHPRGEAGRFRTFEGESAEASNALKENRIDDAMHLLGSAQTLAREPGTAMRLDELHRSLARHRSGFSTTEQPAAAQSSVIPDIVKVGPHGYEHGWIKVGDASSVHGKEVHGLATGAGGKQVTGKYDHQSHSVRSNGVKVPVSHVQLTDKELSKPSTNREVREQFGTPSDSTVRRQNRAQAAADTRTPEEREAAGRKAVQAAHEDDWLAKRGVYRNAPGYEPPYETSTEGKSHDELTDSEKAELAAEKHQAEQVFEGDVAREYLDAGGDPHRAYLMWGGQGKSVGAGPVPAMSFDRSWYPTNHF